MSLVGPGGLLSGLTKQVLETALEAELTEHLGHERGAEPLGLNMRNGTRAKRVLTEIGPVEIHAPWAEFVPVSRIRRGDPARDLYDERIESINARCRRVVNARGHFPNEAAAMKRLYLTRWKPALNAFAITFAGRFETTTH